MMGARTGNPAWKDHPDTSTPITAAKLNAIEAAIDALGGSSSLTADDNPEVPAEGSSASYLVSSAVTWPANLVWSTDPDGGEEPVIDDYALVSLFTLGGVTRAILGATFPGVVVPDTTAPSTVTGLTATATGDTTVNLAWSAATDNVGVTGYEYRIGGGAAVDAGAGTTETVTGLTAGTLYSFEVRAYDAAGNRSAAWSAAATATTTAPDTTPPVWTATLTPGTPTTTSVVVTASALATDANAITYERTLDSTAGTPVWTAIVPSGLNFTLDGLTTGTVYANCALRAKDAAGNLSTVLAVPSFTTAAAAASLADAILALNPVGYWKLDETSGTQATDYSGYARHGTYSGDFTLAAGSFATLGSTGVVTIPDHDDFTAAGSTNGFSVFGLVYRTSTGGLQGALASKHSGTSANTEWSMEVDKDNKVLSYVMAGTTYLNAELSSTGTVTLSDWHAVAATMPEPVAGLRSKHYVDNNTPEVSTSIASGTPTLVNTTQPVTIGMRGDGSRSFVGKLGHVAIFRKELTAAEVGTLMAAAASDGLI